MRRPHELERPPGRKAGAIAGRLPRLPRLAGESQPDLFHFAGGDQGTPQGRKQVQHHVERRQHVEDHQRVAGQHAGFDRDKTRQNIQQQADDQEEEHLPPTVGDGRDDGAIDAVALQRRRRRLQLLREEGLPPAAVDLEPDNPGIRGQLDRPGVLRPRPLAEPARAGLVRRLAAGGEEARKCR